MYEYIFEGILFENIFMWQIDAWFLYEDQV